MSMIIRQILFLNHPLTESQEIPDDGYYWFLIQFTYKLQAEHKRKYLKMLNNFLFSPL